MLVDDEVGARTAPAALSSIPGAWNVRAHALKKQHRKSVVLPFDPRITRPSKAACLPPASSLISRNGSRRSRLDAAIARLLERAPELHRCGAEGAAARGQGAGKQIVAELGSRVTARERERAAARWGSLAFPVIVKPQFGDASDAISNSALVRSESQLSKRIADIRKRSPEPLLCEEFVAGRDLFVALLGNEPEVMPPLELVVGRRAAGAPQLATFK